MDLEPGEIENDENKPSPGKILEGTVIYWTNKHALFQYIFKNSVCHGFFRPNNVFINGVKIKKKEKNNLDAFFHTHGLNVHVTNFIPHSTGLDFTELAFKLDNDHNIVKPEFMAINVWIGKEKPPQHELMNGEKKAKEYKVLEDVCGQIINFDSRSKTGWMKFNQSSWDVVVKFKLETLFLGGERPSKDKSNGFFIDILKKPPSNRIVKFDCVYESVERPVDLNDGEGIKTFEQKWSATLLWPFNEKRPAIECIRKPVIYEVKKFSKFQSEYFNNKNNDSTYFEGTLSNIFDNQNGIISTPKRTLRFCLNRLFISGIPGNTLSDSLYNILNVGDELFGFLKEDGISPYKEPEVEETLLVWKEKRKITVLKETLMDQDNQKFRQNNFPMPWEATFKEMDASILTSDGVIGKARLTDNSKLVLFTRSRCYVDGLLLKFIKDVNYFHQNVHVKMDIVEADPNESHGEYDYVAVLVWLGEKPKEEDVTKEIENPTSFRAKVIKLAPPIPDVGIASGVLHILNGSSFANQRVIFNRDVVYIFSFPMAKGDLGYVLKELDKVNVEFKPTTLEEKEKSLQMYGCAIKYKASCVWIGYFPRAVVGAYDTNNLTPFLEKRNLTLKKFKDIVDGNCQPKDTPSPDDHLIDNIDDCVLPPNNLIGRLIEIKKPDHGSIDGTKRGVMRIENGPHSQKKAFFNRNSLFIYGRNMHKADLMRVVNESDKFFIEFQGDTNNSHVPFKITIAWIGLHPNNFKKDKQILSPYFRNKFNNWLISHHMTEEDFEECVSGKSKIKDFFPFKSEQMNARISYFYPPTKDYKRGVEFGILKIVTGPLTKRDVFFERSDFYLFNVCLKNVDLSKLLKEGDKVFCEASEIIGRDRKKWQARLGVSGVPHYSANLVWLSGSRPKATYVNNNYTRNNNLYQWLRKRDCSMETFQSLVNNTSTSPKSQTGLNYNDDNSNDSVGDQTPVKVEKVEYDEYSKIVDLGNSLVKKVLKCNSSNDDDGLHNVITTETELNLAIFLHDCLKKAISFKCGDPKNESKYRPSQGGPYEQFGENVPYDSSLGWANKESLSLDFGDDDDDDISSSSKRDFSLKCEIVNTPHHPDLQNLECNNFLNHSSAKLESFSSIYGNSSLPALCRSNNINSMSNFSDSYFSLNSNIREFNSIDSSFDIFEDKLSRCGGKRINWNPSCPSPSQLPDSPRRSPPQEEPLFHSPTGISLKTHGLIRIRDEFKEPPFKRKFSPK